MVVRFIHTSDWQLGMTRAFLSDEAAPRFGQARIDAITRLGELARENDAAFIVVAGDVFESNQVSRQTLMRAVGALKALPVPVFLLPGNHDPLDGASVFTAPEFCDAADQIRVIGDQTPLPVPGLAGVEVVGAPWYSKHPTSDLCGDLVDALSPADTTLRVAVGHGQVDTLSPDAARPEIVNLARVEAAINDKRIHYLALGDRHSLTEVGSTGRVWYSGAPVATDFDEVDPNQALLVELAVDGRCSVVPLDVGDWRFIARQFDLNDEADLVGIRAWLHGLGNKACSIVKLGFTGSVNLAVAAQLDKLMEESAPLFASLRRRARTTDLSIVPDRLDEDSVALSGYARAAWEELLESADVNPAARDALRLFYRLSEQGAER